ncbi:MAG: NAD(P)H-dependent oxidoreductase [Gemmatimonadetes bacterium]|nr:NAD(P)H-dependent oxidoreductase [Gemmatimonadota bacterium]
MVAFGRVVAVAAPDLDLGESVQRIVSVSGTSRPDNYTSHALAVVNEELSARGHPPDVIDARQLALAFPGQESTDDAKELRSRVESCSGLVLATPEYHGSFSAMTKLIIENLGFPSVLAGKPVALVGVAAGRIGAIKSLEQLRGICAHVGALVLPGSISIAGVRSAFDENGRCIDEKAEQALRGVATSLLSFIENYVCPKFALEELVRGEGRTWTSSI